MADIALSRDFLGAYARLPRKAQRKLDELLTKFRHDSTAAALHVEPIRQALDPLLRSARIGDDYRVILRAPERGDVFIALWADHHDEAYRWAEKKQTAVHPATGTLQIYDVDEAVRAVTLEPHVSTLAVAGILEIVGLFAAHDDEALFTAGVPRALLPSVRAVATDDELERLAPHLPPEAGEVLTGLAAGLSLDEALEEVLGRPTPPAAAPEPAPIDPADIKTALQREATQRQFFLLSDALDLDAALRHPLDTWRVFLHPKQRRLAHTRAKGPMRVTGAAGTGKTVVALHRTAFLVREVFPKPDDRVLLTTFNVNLAHDLRAQLSKLLGPDDLARVEITNIDRWASEYLRRHGESFQQLFADEQRVLLRQVHDVYGPDGFDLDFCLAEWREVVQEQDLRTEENYVRAVRHYRGVPLSRAQRRTLWPVFVEYRQLLEEGRRLEPLDVMRRARAKLEASAEPPRYRAVVVDETQDFSAEALRLVRAIAGPEHPDDLFLVGDAHQRIYGRKTALSACGISVRGRRSQTLRINYRTTAPISRLAFGALHGVEVDDLDDGKADRWGAVCLRDGQEPVLSTFASPQEEEAAVVATVKGALDRGIPPEAIAVIAPAKYLLEQRFEPALVEAGVDAVIIEQEEPRRAAVRLATLHRVKGLEFPVVIVAGASADFIPYPSPELTSTDPIVRDQALLRERCLLYVATSRARDELYVYCHGTPSPLLSVVPRVRRAAPARQPSSVPPATPPAPDQQGFAPSASPPDRKPEDTRLDTLDLPTRMATFVSRRELSTVGELASISPADLLEERNLGRGSIAATRAILETVLGTTWESFAEGDSDEHALGEPTTLAAVAGSANWDVVRTVLSETQRKAPLAVVDLSARARSFAEREGIVLLGDLARKSRAELFAAPNLGRSTVKDIAAAVVRHFERLEHDRELLSLGFLDAFKTLVQELDQIERIILSRRSALSGAEATLEELGEMFGVTRERVRQIEARACEALRLRVGWVEPARTRMLDAIANGAVPLSTLGHDPWWAAASEFPATIEYVTRSILEIEVHIVTRNEAIWLGPMHRSQIDSIVAQARARLADLNPPVGKEVVDRLLSETLAPLGNALAGDITQELAATLHVEHLADGSERVVGIGKTRRAELLAILRASPTPMRIEDVYDRLGARMMLPDEVLNFDRGVVGLAQHFPDYEAWKERLAPAARDLMQRLAPERQWATSELLDELREQFDLPAGFNGYWLGALLRDADGIKYLGRNRVALTGAHAAESRIYIHEALEKLLRDAGAPVVRSLLLDRLTEQLGATDFALAQVFGRPQFVRLSEDRIGLRDRDVPGGESAAREASDLIETLLIRREVGLSAWQAHQEVRGLSPVHEAWRRELSLSILRSDARFRLNQSGSIGLATWEGTRVPTKLELLRAALAASGGTVSVEALSARIEAHYGESPNRGLLASLASGLGASLDGDWVRRR